MIYKLKKNFKLILDLIILIFSLLNSFLFIFIIYILGLIIYYNLYIFNQFIFMLLIIKLDALFYIFYNN